MGCGCYGSGYQRARSFLTKEERITMLKEYQDELDKEKQGISERIKELEASYLVGFYRIFLFFSRFRKKVCSR
jgi:hypothetical protein